jgi:hypothetical protein
MKGIENDGSIHIEIITSNHQNIVLSTMASTTGTSIEHIKRAISKEAISQAIFEYGEVEKSESN